MDAQVDGQVNRQVNSQVNANQNNQVNTQLDPETRQRCLEAIQSLTDNEYKVLSVTIGFNPLGVVLKKSQVAALLGITPTRVSTILQSAYRKLSVPEIREALKVKLETQLEG